MREQRKFGLAILALALISTAIIWAVGLGEATEETDMAAQMERETLYSYIKLLDKVAFDINQRYVDSIDVKEMVYSGIKGMIETLDPFTALQDVEAHDRLMEMTEGKYEGLGMTISERDNVITVISPIEGTPAYRMGLRAGDQIVKIDGKSTQGMTTEDASKMMRGKAGTSVALTIKREGVAESLEYDVERAVIELTSVPYYGMMDGGIGYVRLSKFSKDSGKELRDAIVDLKKQGMKAMVLDLRSNGGGLLDQAVETSNLFLDKGKLIVYTEGRTEFRNERDATVEPVFSASDGPLAVLVNEGTASASEIVSGAIQDWDRGVIIGNTTFGKGLVQQIIPERNQTYLKLTVAKYYIPSGRCIQKPERAVRQPVAQQEEEVQPADTEAKARSDTLVQTDKEVFYTKGGRKVYGGGGVVPDIEIPPEEMQPLEMNLLRQSMFFSFAVSYIAEHPNVSKDFEVDQSVLDEFKRYLKQKDFTYESVLELQLDPLREKIAKAENPEIFSGAMAQLESAIQKDKDDDFEENLDQIKESLKGAILSNKFGEKAYYEEVLLKADPYVLKARQVLTDQTEYMGMLKQKEG
jgi:carboxyl-terminal processing protease